ncbi:hypothetical protein FRC09_009727 [Ceratobasidium sp. 395]|nr:hypothetical protein FRC09_009727 [Ceratobasidium sp. 395]
MEDTGGQEGGLAGGLSALMIFKELTARVCAAGGSSQIRKLCKMMAGTGTGALIACMLVLLEFDIDRAIATYSRLVQSVFSGKVIRMSGSGAFQAGKLEKELKQIVQEATGDENTLMMKTQHDEDDCKVMVFAKSERSVGASARRIFRSYQVLTNQMPNYPIWQVLRATMAHPELFKSFEIGNTLMITDSLVGGDVACSNPTPYVLAEFSTLYPELRITSVVCIGAGHARTIQIPGPNPLQRFMPMNVLIAMKNTASDNEKVAQEIAARFQSTPDVYFRFNVDQGVQDVRMSRWQEKSEVAAHTRSYMQKTEVDGQIDKVAQLIAASKRALVRVDIGRAVQQPAVQQTTGVKDYPAPSPTFRGHERQISQVTSCLLSHGNGRRVCVVHGLGGSGKTQIALKSVERTQDKWENIVYVDATTRETVTNALKGFAQAREIGDTHEDTLRWLELSPRPWLLVIDNADDPDIRLQNFIPGGPYGSVLITSRLQSLAWLGQGPGSDCSVGGMEPEDAVELLLNKIRTLDEAISTEEMEAAKTLVKDLGYLALAIVHAGVDIFYSKISIAKYRIQCLENARIALDKYNKLPGSIEKYGKIIYTKLKPDTQRVLGLMAYLHHGGITEEIFKRAAGHIHRVPIIPPNDEETSTRKYVRDCLALFLDTDGHWDLNAFSAAMDELVLYSLVDYDRANQVITLREPVQDWTCTVLPHSKTTALMHTSHLLALSIDRSRDLEMHTYRRGLLPHVSKVLAKANKTYANDAGFLALVYRDHGRWNEEEGLWVQVLDLMKQTLGELHPGTLASMADLASTYRKQGRWGKAETLEILVLDARKQTLGDLHPDTLISMGNLASTYRSRHRWDKAEALQVQVLDTMKQTLGELHPDTLITMNNLSSTYQDQGRWDEAEALQVRAVDGMKRTLGELHPDTLTTMANLASTCSYQDRWDEAEALQVQVMDGLKQTLGAEPHPDIITSMANLALTYSNQGRWNEAETLQVQVVDGMKRTLGDLHPDTLASMNNLAATYRKQGRWNEAVALHVQVSDEMEQRPVLISRTMPLSEIVAHLRDRGCSDITDQLNLASSSEYSLFNGGFGEVYKVKLNNGTQVAIKTMRMQVNCTEEGTKHLKVRMSFYISTYG